MKVNTDSVLLPAWVNIPVNTALVLDVGCGTGVISLIVAQRLSHFPGSSNESDYSVTGIDIDKFSCEESMFNFANSQWSENLNVVHTSFQEYSLNADEHCKYNLILSNPPYFTNSLKAPSHQRSNARHNHLLPMKDMIERSRLLLGEGGLLALILPEKEAEETMALVKQFPDLTLTRLCKVKTLAYKRAKRFMLEIRKQSIPESTSAVVREEELVIQKEGGVHYTSEYINLVKDLYTKEFEIRD